MQLGSHKLANKFSDHQHIEVTERCVKDLSQRENIKIIANTIRTRESLSFSHFIKRTRQVSLTKPANDNRCKTRGCVLMRENAHAQTITHIQVWWLSTMLGSGWCLSKVCSTAFICWLQARHDYKQKYWVFKKIKNK